MTNPPPPNDTPLDPDSQPTGPENPTPASPSNPASAAPAQATDATHSGDQPAPSRAPATTTEPTSSVATSSNPQPTSAQTPVSTSSAPTPAAHGLWHTLTKAAGHSDDLTPEQQITRRTFVSFSAFALLGAAAWKSWFWIKDAVQSDGVQTPLRKVLNADDKIFKHTLSPNHLAKTFPREQAAKNVRYNSGIGLGADPATWRLQVTRASGETLAITMDDLKALPKTDFAFEFKCIEGWSQVSWWGGVRFSDFIQHYNLTSETQKAYVGLSTPDDHYYVGVDTPSMLHPQTILAYEMSGQPLPARHGAPLRLIIPIKYGVKNLKCVGKIFFSNDRPRDYWFERGYDYYCGL